ncbi:MAG: WD40 repeat domain-containing protein [Polyangiaceae bacterium]
MATRTSTTDAIAFSPDGSHVALGGISGVTLWELSSWREDGKVENAFSMSALAFSPDSATLYVGTYGGLRAVDWKAGKVLREYGEPGAAILRLDVTADGSMLVTRGFDEAQLFRIGEAQPVARYKIHGSSGPVLRPDGAALVFPNAPDQLTIQSLGAAAEPPTQLSFHGEVYACAFTQDSARLVVALQGTQGLALQVRDVKTGAVQASVDGVPLHGVKHLSVSPRGDTIALDSMGTQVDVLSLPGLELVRELKFSVAVEGVRAIEYSSDGALLAVSLEQPGPYFFDTSTFTEVHAPTGHRGEIEHVAFSSDGQTIRTVGRDRQACNWKASDLTVVRCVPLPPNCEMRSVREDDGRYGLCQSTDPMLAYADRPVFVVDDDTGETQSTLQLGTVAFLRWPEAERAISVSSTSVQWLEPLTGRIVKKVELAREADAYHLSGSELIALNAFTMPSPLSIQRLDLNTAALATTPEIPHATVVNKRGFTPDGARFWVSSPLEIYDTKTLARLATFDCDGDVAFERTGRRGVCAAGRQNHPGVLVFFDVESGRELSRTTVDTEPAIVRYAPDGRSVVVAYRTGDMEVWQAP